MLKSFFKKALPHVIAVLVFLSLTLAYFSPQLDGQKLVQGDINKHKGMSKEIQDFREVNDEEAMWTNSQFGGMPATQVSVIYRYDILKHIDNLYSLWLKHPAKYLFMYMLGFYILLIIFKADPWLAASGAIAYGFSSYFFTIMEAGHNSKAHAVAYMAPLLGAIILCFRKKHLLGFSLTALFMALELKANHVQVTYYFGFVIAGVFIYYFVKYAKEKAYLDYGKTAGLIIGAVLIAVLPNVPNLYGTYEYTPYTIRGGSELSISPDGKEVEKSNGLKFDYITEWSYGIGESWTLMIPHAKGGPSVPYVFTEEYRDMIKDMDGLTPEQKEQALYGRGMSPYFGDQSFTTSPVYVGAIVCALFFVALFMYSSPFKWVLLIVSLIVLMLSWGKNYPSLTKLFIDVFPMYAKFRAVTIILVIIEFTLPLLVFLWLKEAIKKDDFKENFKMLGKEFNFKKYWVFIGASAMLFLIMFLAKPGSDKDFLNQKETQAMDYDFQYNEQMKAIEQAKKDGRFPEQYIGQEAQIAQQNATKTVEEAKVKNEIHPKIRREIYNNDFNRSLMFAFFGLALCFAFLWFRFDYRIFVGVLTIMILGDLWPVAKRYLHNDPPQDELVRLGVEEPGDYKQWTTLDNHVMPYTADVSDVQILASEIQEDQTLIDKINKSIGAYEGEEKPAPLDKMMTYQRYTQDPKTQRVKKNDAPTPIKLSEKLAFRELNFNTHYRVLNTNVGIVQDGVSPYFHKSLSGYHGAKLNRYQDLVVFYLGEEQAALRSNAEAALPFATVTNMLNTKYVVTNPGRPPVKNPHANGHAWFVKGYESVENPDAEILRLKGLNTKDSAILDKKFAEHVDGWDLQFDSDATIELVDYKPNHMTYEVNGVDTEQLAVFSEVYYPLGWQAYIDGKPVDHFRADYILRALRVPAGTKKIEFKYELDSYSWTTNVSLAGTSILLIIFILALYRELKPMLEAQEEEQA